MNIQQFYPIFKKANQVTIDSRTIEINDIFFAFSGQQFNAATFANDAIAKGALAVIVEQREFENSEKNIFFVPSTLVFLQDLAKYHRRQLKIPIIGLTGSNGKTTSKELIHAVLSQKFKTQFTKGNLNNHIGVPLSILSIKPEHELAVVEMGANHQKEIEFLCTISQPDFGYITNFGKAHLEGFGGVEGVIKGKSELYDYLKTHGKTFIIDENDSIQIQKSKEIVSKITFGKENSDYFFQQFSEKNKIGIKYQGESMLSHLTGDYNFSNLSVAVSLGLHFGIPISHIKEAIENYIPNNMRSQVVEKNNKTLILDTYNANPSSMMVSIQNFSNFKGSKAIILGDMLELGAETEIEHKTILEYAHQLNFNQIITVGIFFQSTGISAIAFKDTDELKNYLINNPLDVENILLKGSRGIALEKIIDFL